MKRCLGLSLIGLMVFLVTGGAGRADDGNVMATPEPGVYRTYHCAFRDENTTTLFPNRMGTSGAGPGTFMSTLDFDGDLRVRDYGQVGENRVLGFSVDAVRVGRFALNGHDVFDTPDMFPGTFIGSEVYVTVDDHHAIRRFHFPEGPSQAFKQFMVTLIGEIQVSVRADKGRWDAEETNQHGRGRVDYAVKGRTGQTLELLKTRKNYDYPGLIDPADRQDIKTDDTIRWNTRGFIEAIDKREDTTITAPDGDTVLQVRKTLRLSQAGQGTFDPKALTEGRLASLETAAPGQAIPDKAQNREFLLKQAARTSYDQIESWIEGFNPDASRSRADNAMFYRSTGFVELHPRSAENLAAYCMTQADRSLERTLVMNLLAAVASPEAQSAMRTILSDPGIRKDPQYGIMMQNFSLMEKKPEPETLDFLAGQIRGTSQYAAVAAAHAYGACVHKLYVGGEKDRALSLSRLLVDKLRGAASDDERVEYIGALGNAGMMEHTHLLFDCLADPTPTIRAEAVMALRKTESPMVRKTVLTLFADSDRGVQRSAIQTVVHYTPEAGDVRGILDQLNQGLIEEANFYDLTTLLKKNLGRHPDLVRNCLKAMVRKKLKDPDLEARIRTLL